MATCTVRVKELVVVILFTKTKNNAKALPIKLATTGYSLPSEFQRSFTGRHDSPLPALDSPGQSIASKTEVCWSLEVVLPAHWRGANTHLGGGTATNATSSHACRCFFSQRQPGNPTPQQVVDLKALPSSSATDKATLPDRFPRPTPPAPPLPPPPCPTILLTQLCRLESVRPQSAFRKRIAHVQAEVSIASRLSGGTRTI